jgi:hypothetical protein
MDSGAVTAPSQLHESKQGTAHAVPCFLIAIDHRGDRAAADAQSPMFDPYQIPHQSFN